MKTSINKVMLLSVLAMMLTTSGIATANKGDYAESGMRGHMEDGIERGEKGEKRYDGEHSENHEEIMTALKAGDYSLLSDEAKEKISEDEFNEKIATGLKYKKRGPGKHFKKNHAEMVAKIVQTADLDKLERALAKINSKIDHIEDEVVLDLLEGIREVIENALNA